MSRSIKNTTLVNLFIMYFCVLQTISMPALGGKHYNDRTIDQQPKSLLKYKDDNITSSYKDPNSCFCETGAKITHIKCKPEKAEDCSENDFILCIKNMTSSNCIITSKKNKVDKHCIDEYLTDDCLTYIGLDFTTCTPSCCLTNTNDFRCIVENNKLDEISSFSSEFDSLHSNKILISDELTFYLPGLEKVSRSMPNKFCMQYHVQLNTKSTKKNVGKKYLFILKDPRGKIIKEEAFNGSSFTVIFMEQRDALQTCCFQTACTLGFPVAFLCKLMEAF